MPTAAKDAANAPFAAAGGVFVEALYMAAVATLRNGSPLLAFYKKLREAGKPAKVALIALARKILVTLNAMIRSNTAFRA